MLKSLQEFYTPLKLVNKKAALEANATIIQKPFIFLLVKHGLLTTLIPGKFLIDKYTNQAIPAFNMQAVLKKLNNKSFLQVTNFLKDLGNILDREKSWIFQVMNMNIYKYADNHYAINIASPKEKYK